MLYIIATPIGNLSDLSYRAVETLKTCDYILCEDTRHSSTLLKHYQIQKTLKSYHLFNESKELNLIIKDLKNNLNIALISDAGTPVICDPGHQLIQKCREEQVEVTSIGGPCAVILALTLSGFNPLPFQFVGFLPKKQSELKTLFTHLLLYEGTSIAYETPHRIEATLTLIESLEPERSLCIMRELTKRYEECLLGRASQLLTAFQQHPPRGEMVLLIKSPPPLDNWSHLSLKEHVLLIQTQWDLSLNDAIKMVAKIRQIPKRAIYQAAHDVITPPPQGDGV